MTQIETREIREITEVDLVEISVVSTPANPSSLFTLAKSVKEFFDNQRNEEETKEIKTDILETACENQVTPETVEEKADEVEILKIETEKQIQRLTEEIEKQQEIIDSQKAIISELTDKTVSLESKIQKVGVRKATIITGTENTFSKTISYFDLIKR
jgi:hypothetical protein